MTNEIVVPPKDCADQQSNYLTQVYRMPNSKITLVTKNGRPNEATILNGKWSPSWDSTEQDVTFELNDQHKGYTVGLEDGTSFAELHRLLTLLGL